MYEVREAEGFRVGERVRFKPSRQGCDRPDNDEEAFYTPDFLVGETGRIVEAWSQGPFLLSVILDGGDEEEIWSCNPDDIEAI
jgi:hypothetical protein